jgi:hypothetical protein
MASCETAKAKGLATNLCLLLGFAVRPGEYCAQRFVEDAESISYFRSPYLAEYIFCSTFQKRTNNFFGGHAMQFFVFSCFVIPKIMIQRFRAVKKTQFKHHVKESKRN